MMKSVSVADRPMLDLDSGRCSATGRVRSVNQDYLGQVEPGEDAASRAKGWLFVLADGVGGGESGDVAAREAVETICAGFRAAGPGESAGALLKRLVQEANLQVYNLGQRSKPGGATVATTIVACLLRGDRATIAHAGDSRAYHARDGRARVLTRDHTRGNARLWPWSRLNTNTSHVLVRALGIGMIVPVSLREVELRPGDGLMLTSDGLHVPVDADELAAALAGDANLDRSARALALLAETRDGSDNISVVLIRIRAVGRPGAA